jgi:hypothetical protein
MLQSGRHTAFVRAMIMQVLVQLRGYRVFDRCFHRVGRETSAYPFAEARRSATLTQCSDTGARHGACHRTFTDCAFLPMFDIGMPLWGNDRL